MPVEFWFDPICPFCWVTSRWLVQVAPERDLDITWMPISLLFKNELTEDSPWYAGARRTTDLLRVVEAVRDGGDGARIGALYTEFGRHIHHRGDLDFDVVEVLNTVGLDPAYARALTDETWDSSIRTGMDAGLALVGNEVGTPIIAIDGPDGPMGFFGPVINELPSLEDSLELWDGFTKLVKVADFFELKRTRTGNPVFPDEALLG